MSGSGTAGDPFVPVLILSEDAENAAECRDDGLYVPALGLLSFVGTSTSQNGVTSADLTGLTLTITVISGRRIRLAYCELNPTGSNTSDEYELRIQEGGTVVQTGFFRIASGNDHNRIVNISRIITPSAGSHTYKVAVVRAIGVGTINFNRSATCLAYFSAEDLG